MGAAFLSPPTLSSSSLSPSLFCVCVCVCVYGGMVSVVHAYGECVHMCVMVCGMVEA